MDKSERIAITRRDVRVLSLARHKAHVSAQRPSETASAMPNRLYKGCVPHVAAATLAAARGLLAGAFIAKTIKRTFYRCIPKCWTHQTIFYYFCDTSMRKKGLAQPQACRTESCLQVEPRHTLATSQAFERMHTFSCHRVNLGTPQYCEHSDTRAAHGEQPRRPA